MSHLSQWPKRNAQSESRPSRSQVVKTCLCLQPDCASLNTLNAEHCHNCRSALSVQRRFRAVHRLGKGRFSCIYQAIDTTRDRPCVIKQFVPQGLAAEVELQTSAQDLFRQEALILQRLGHHAQIPQLLAFEQHEEICYLVQEFVPGRSLYQHAKQRGSFSPDHIQRILLDLLPVLDFIHAQGIIHRDIKLGNVIQATDGRHWLVDFGGAYHKNLGRFGIAGTPGYAAPEQLQGKALPASDLYSLAVTCVSLLSGQLLENSTVNFHAPEEFLSTLDNLATQGLDSYLLQVLSKMLQPQVAKRYSSAKEVLQALQVPLVTTPQPVDYGVLQQLLAAESYSEADQETWRLLLQLSDRQPHQGLDLAAIARIKPVDWRILNQLWLTASGGRFGFSSQRQVFNAPLDSLDYQHWQAFATQLGWYQQGKWQQYEQLQFHPAAPVGHLPVVYVSPENRQGEPLDALGWWRLGFLAIMEHFD